MVFYFADQFETTTIVVQKPQSFFIMNMNEYIMKTIENSYFCPENNLFWDYMQKCQHGLHS